MSPTLEAINWREIDETNQRRAELTPEELEWIRSIPHYISPMNQWSR